MAEEKKEVGAKAETPTTGGEKKAEEVEPAEPKAVEAKAEKAKATEVKAEEKQKEQKELSPAVKKIVDSVAKLNPEDRSQLGLEIIKNLTVMELSEWVKSMEEEFGVSAAPVMASGVAAHGAALGETKAEEEQTEFQVILVSAGDKKIQVIKEVRVLTSLGLKEAKDLVDNPPKPVKEGIPKKEAEEIKAKLEAQGAKVELK